MVGGVELHLVDAPAMAIELMQDGLVHVGRVAQFHHLAAAELAVPV